MNMVILCILLVVLQAICSLMLPDYMSDIVNYGIQRYGIEDSVPQQVSTETWNALMPLMTGQEQALANDSYTIKSSEGKSAYALNAAIDDAAYTALDAAFGRAFAAVASRQTGYLVPIFPDGNIVETMSGLEEAERESTIARIDELFAGIGANIGQMATAMIISEYEKTGVDIYQYQMRYILKTGLKMLVISLLILLFTIIPSYLSSHASSNFGRDLRHGVYAKVMSFSKAEMNDFSVASLITRTTNDIQQVQQVVMMLMRIVIFAPVMGIGGVIFAVNKSPSMTWTIALALILLVGMLLIMFVAVMPRFKKLQKLVDRLNLVARENISGVMVSRAYNNQDFEMERFNTANENLSKTDLFLQRVTSLAMPIMNLIMNGLTILILWVGADYVSQMTLQIGDMMAFIQYAMHVVMSFLIVSMLMVMIPRAGVSAKRIQEVLLKENSIVDPNMTVELGNDADKRGWVQFLDVSFKYPAAEKEVLKGISFTAKPGEITGIIGATGSGKSTIIDLIMRFFDATEGVVKLNGIDIKQLSQEDLRSEIGYVPQKSILFSGTIAENLRLGAEDASEERLLEAARVAQAESFITEREGQLAAEITQGGTNLSGGQKQRMSIARALAKKAPVYLFDDSFSALDFKTDSLLRKALQDYAKNSAVILVAQRVASIKNAQQILVLDDGEIVGCGTHKTLIESCPIYLDIARSQLREGEAL